MSIMYLVMCICVKDGKFEILKFDIFAPGLLARICN